MALGRLIAEKIRRFRENEGLSQLALSKLGIAYRTIQDLEKSTANPRIETIEKISEIMGVPAWTLIFDENRSSTSHLDPALVAALAALSEDEKRLVLAYISGLSADVPPTPRPRQGLLESKKHRA